MIKRKKFLTALICVILSLITALCFAFTGCAEYAPPESETPDTPVTPVEPIEPTDPAEDENAFSVQLTVKSKNKWQNFTYEFYEASDGMKGAHKEGWVEWSDVNVQWIDVQTGERFIAPLNEDGKSVCSDLDGDYKVTLTNVPTGFTYEPNVNTASNFTKSIEIVIYQVQKAANLGKTLYLGSDHNVSFKNVQRIESTGAYRVTLKSSSDKVMFSYTPPKQGSYSLATLVDTTQNKINPKLGVYKGNLASGAIYFYQEKDDGGSSNSYTKNVAWYYYLTANEAGGNSLIFQIYSTSIDGEASYPIVVDFLLQRDGDYTKDSYKGTVVEVTEDFTKTPTKPDGTFTWAARSGATANLLLDCDTVILNTEDGIGNKTVLMGEQAIANDGYYYYYSYDAATKTYTLTDRLYAVINMANEIVDFTNPLMKFRYLQGYNYTSFVNAYKENCNSDGAYPVNEELMWFLQRYCLEQRLFNDGYGLAETTPVSGGYYASDEESMWMFSCGYYKK